MDVSSLVDAVALDWCVVVPFALLILVSSVAIFVHNGPATVMDPSRVATAAAGLICLLEHRRCARR